MVIGEIYMFYVSIPGISIKSWVQQDCMWLKNAPGAASLQK